MTNGVFPIIGPDNRIGGWMARNGCIRNGPFATAGEATRSYNLAVWALGPCCTGSKA